MTKIKDIIDIIGIKKIIFLVSLMGIILVLSLFKESVSENEVIKYIEKKGYKSDIKNILYTKNIGKMSLSNYNKLVAAKKNASYEENFFYVNESKLVKNIRENEDGLNTTYTLNYDYKTSLTSYTYRLVVNDNSVLMYEGSYDIYNDKFSCDESYHFDFDVSGIDGEFCDVIEERVKYFSIEAFELIDSTVLLSNIMKR